MANVCFPDVYTCRSRYLHYILHTAGAEAIHCGVIPNYYHLRDHPATFNIPGKVKELRSDVHFPDVEGAAADGSHVTKCCRALADGGRRPG